MNTMIKIGRCFYAIALIVYAAQQFVFKDFRPVFVPAWQSQLPGLAIWAYAFGILLILTAIAILTETAGRTASLYLGLVLLLFFVFIQIPFELISDPHSKHLAMWTNAFKELALSGGAFVVAGTFISDNKTAETNSGLLKFAEKLVPAGRIFFCITMITFGLTHFLYAIFVSKLVPVWIPGSMFWTYVAAVALIGAGLAIMFNIKTRQIAMLLSIMLFIWFIILHLPRAFEDPLGQRGNEFASSFDALAFCGIAIMIASQTSNEVRISTVLNKV